MVSLDSNEKLIFDAIQMNFPICSQPFLDIGRQTGLTEAKVIDTVIRLKARKLIRQTGAIYNTEKLGFKSTLIAMKAEDQRIDSIAEIINRHPGVSHNYKRNGMLNLWFTIAVPKNCSLKNQIRYIANSCRIMEFYNLKAKKTFKKRVVFKMGTSKEPGQQVNKNMSEYHLNDDVRMMVLKDLQDNFVITDKPFKIIADKYDIPEKDLLNYINNLLHNKTISRFAAIINHRNAGYNSNAMVVWNIPEAMTEKFGRFAATFDKVSHCYQRQSYPEWNYSLYTMIHGRENNECQMVINALKEKFGKTDFAILYSSKEYKKKRIDYFSQDYKNWE